MSNVFGFSNLKKDEQKESDSGDTNEQKNEYYAGGASDRGGGSGLSVIGPGDEGRRMESIIRQAQSGGAAESGAASAETNRVITFYQNGFTVDGGPFRSLTDPENQPFLQDVENGRVPREFEGADRNLDVHVTLEDKRSEVYTPPAYVAFSGSGQTMGSSGTGADTSAVLSSADESPGNFEVDESKPTTTLQIRLLNGKRIRQKFNLSHTVGDIQKIIRIHDQSNSGQRYVLLSGFPPKPLQDVGMTLEDAGLQGAAITQKTA